MVRFVMTFIVPLLTLSAGNVAPAVAQPHPLTPIAVDPDWGQICAGIPEPFFGAAPCSIVQQELDIRARVGLILPTLAQIGFDPFAGPVCAGPLGQGPCIQVARWVAMQQLAQAQLPPLTQIGNAPAVGPICAGPLGPGPCEAVRL